MKRSHIIALIFIAIAVGAIMAMTMRATTYSGFAEAEANLEKKFTVIGSLNRNREIESRANYLSFYMVDENGKECKVVVNESKPQDFERSESITVEGMMKDDGVFYAHSLLMKCPSKYNESTHSLK
jgi:cytochrome c-type biogenesis protein CcmE